MRNILFNWFFEVHTKFRLKDRTLFLTGNILDRYMQKFPVSRKNLQLVGIASFLIASKFEDIYPPDISELCFLCENVYTKDQILQQEGKILSFLNFDLIFVSAFDVMDHYNQALDIKNQSVKDMTSMILKLFLYKNHIGKYNSFKLAAFALDFANKLILDADTEIKYIINEQEEKYLINKLKITLQEIKLD